MTRRTKSVVDYEKVVEEVRLGLMRLAENAKGSRVNVSPSKVYYATHHRDGSHVPVSLLTAYYIVIMCLAKDCIIYESHSRYENGGGRRVLVADAECLRRRLGLQ